MAWRRIPPKPSAALSAPPGSLLSFVEPFLESLRVRNYSEATLKGREHYLTAFHRWLLERGVEEVLDVTPQILERYRRHLSHYRQMKGKGQREGQPLSFRSQHSHLLPLRAFFKWMARQRHLLYNPASELELPRLEKRLPKHVLTVAEVEQLLSAPDLASPLGLRDRAMMEVVYSTGMRRGEVARLKVYDLDRERGTVFIRQGKGKKDRVVPIGARALAWVTKYVAEVRSLFAVEPDEGSLFLAPDGGALSPGTVTAMVTAYLKASGIGKTGACHLLRHTCATLMLEGGADIRYIQQLLGHSELSTTEIYTQVSIRRLKAVHTLTHPAKAESHAAADARKELEAIEGTSFP